MLIQAQSFLLKRELDKDRKQLDVWTPSKRSKSEQKEFKDNLIAFYQRGVPQPAEKQSVRLKCMILDEVFQRDVVKAAHLWKDCTHGEGLELFGLTHLDVGSPRNGLLLYKTIEEAFDNKRLCFLWNPLQKVLTLHLLDPELRHETFHEHRSFEALEGKALQYPQGNMPYRRILGFHAKVAFDYALRQNWITPEVHQQFQDFTTVSEGATAPRVSETAAKLAELIQDLVE